MSEIRKDLFYTKDHEWVKKTAASNVIVMGISDFAHASLGDVTFVQLPELGKVFRKGEVLGTVESVKAVSDIYAPVSGKVTKRNEGLLNDPSILNTSPFDKAWLVELESSNEAEFQQLLAPGAYESIAQ